MRCLLGILLAMWAAGAAAETFVVTKESDDDGPCTVDDCALREAVLAANALPGADVIEVPGGTYQLSLMDAGALDENDGLTGDIDIMDDLELRGDPTTSVTLIGNGSNRLLHLLGFTVVEISHLVLTGGVSDSGGGAIRATNEIFVLRHSSVLGNRALGDGGGIQIGGLTMASVEASTISANRSERRGGGIFVTLSTPFNFVNVINTTISGNTAFSGGGIYLFGTAFMSVTNSTIADNTASNLFSDGLVGDITNRLTISNSLFVNNECGYISAIPMSNGHNLESPTDTCFVPGEGNQVAVPDALLAPLGDYGGPTPTHALLPGSPAIDAALDADCPAADQRGVGRPVDGDFDGTATCDVGAYETAAALPAPTEVPTLSEIGFVLLTIGIGLAGTWLVRRAG